MMRRLLVVALVLGLASGASAALTFVSGPTDSIGIGETVTILVNNSNDGNYSGWLEIANPAVADFDGDPVFTTAGSPDGNSTMTLQSQFGAWYEFGVTSFNPGSPVTAGDHIEVMVTGVSEGTTSLNLYAANGVDILDTVAITVVPEPMTIALLSLGGLFLCRRK